MNKIRKIRKNKEITKRKINRIKSLYLKIFLVVLNFIFATFAWFIYEMTLEVDVDVNVSAWKVDFKENDKILETAVEFEIENFYPGMEDYQKTIEIENLGERAASITYEIEQLKILGKQYEIKESASAGDSEYTLYSSKTVENGKNVIKLLNNSNKFPFEITLIHSQEIYTQESNTPESNKGTFEIYLTWPYEITGNESQKEIKNKLDTQWGYDIANFYKSLPEGSDMHGIEIIIQAIAKQIID